MYWYMFHDDKRLGSMCSIKGFSLAFMRTVLMVFSQTEMTLAFDWISTLCEHVQSISNPATMHTVYALLCLNLVLELCIIHVITFHYRARLFHHEFPRTYIRFITFPHEMNSYRQCFVFKKYLPQNSDHKAPVAPGTPVCQKDEGHLYAVSVSLYVFIPGVFFSGRNFPVVSRSWDGTGSCNLSTLK